MTEVENICRICLSVIQDDNYKFLEEILDITKGESLRDLLHFCVPEIDSYVSANPTVCLNCFNNITNLYSFKLKCMDTENKIKEYIIKNNLVEYNHVNLNCVVNDAKKNVNNQFTNKIILAKTLDNNFVIINGYQNSLINVKPPEISTFPQNSDVLLYCKKCPYISTDSSKMSQHKCVFAIEREKVAPVETDYDKRNDFPCNRCSLVCDTMQALRNHIAFAHMPEQLKNCPQCHYRTPNWVSLKRHMGTHKTPSLLQCSKCSYQTKDRSNFKKHEFVHTKKPHKCNFCKYCCVSPYQMRKHLQNIHTKETKKKGANLDTMFSTAVKNEEEEQWVGHSM